MLKMTPRENIHSLIKEMDAQRAELSELARLPNEEIKAKFHDAVVNTLKSLAARADNMEANQQGLFGF